MPESLSDAFYLMYGLGLEGKSVEILSRINQQASSKRRTTMLRGAMEGAAQRGHVELVRQLLEQGAEVDGRGNSQTPLMRAASEGNLETLRLLLEHGADVNLTDRWDETAIMQAARAGDVAKVSLLLEYGARLTPAFINGKTALDVACGVEIHRFLRAYIAGSQEQTADAESIDAV